MDIQNYKTELDELNQKLADPSKVNSKELGSLFSRQSLLSEIVSVIEELNSIKSQIKESEDLIYNGTEDPEFLELAKLEIEELSSRLPSLESRLKLLTIPQDPNDDKNVIVEVRAGTGGEEASLFANELFRMYSRYATLKKWQVQLMNIADSDSGGVKEVIFKLIGKSVYKTLKYESGVHRVQRVPQTESAGRVHTSAASVVIMPEIDDVEININPGDIRIDVYRSGGNGGQSVNTTDSAVRITHMPTGIVVTCQDTKEQQKNKAAAMSVLRSKLYQLEMDKQLSEISDIRKSSIKTGDRSDKIKTYNFPQDRLTDHRIKKSWFGLDQVMDGEIDDILQETIVDINQ